MKSFREAHSGVQPTIDVSLDTRRQELYLTATVIGLMLSLNVCCSVGRKTLLFEGMMMQILQKVRIREILKLF